MFTPARLTAARDVSKTTSKRALFRVLFALGLASIVSSAEAEPQFTVRSLSGAFGFSAAGTVVPPALPVATPAAAVGTMTFDRNGACVISDTINIGGMSASRTSTTCAYTVNQDGTGSISTLFPGDPGPIPLSFVIVNQENEIRFIRTDLGVATGVAKKQNRD